MGKFFEDKYVGYHTFGLINDFNIFISKDGNSSIDPDFKIGDLESNQELIEGLISAGILPEGTTELYYRDIMDITELPQGNAWVPYNFEEFQFFTGISEIPQGYFSGLKIEKIVLPPQLTAIPNNAFYNCMQLEGIVIPNSVKTIGDMAFARCLNMEYLIIGNSVVSIGTRTFQSCNSLTSVVIPNSVKTIGGNAFNQCTHLLEITIGKSVESIGTSAFMQCSSLNVVYVLPVTPPTLSGTSHFAGTNNCPLVVPKGRVDIYKDSGGWKAYSPRITDTYSA